MAIYHHMIETVIELKHGAFLLMGRVEVSEEEPKFDVIYEIRSLRANKTELAQKISFQATNPLILDDIIIGTATVYGICIAGKLGRKTVKEAVKCYRKSKRENPDNSIWEHAREAGSCLAEKGNVMKDTATDALVDCLKLPTDDDDDDGDI